MTAACEALSVSAIVALVVEYSVVDSLESRATPTSLSSDPRLARLPPYYPVLCQNSLISWSFYKQCQTLLHSHLVFVHGTPQLSKYLDTIESRLDKVSTSKRRNESVSLLDSLPFKQGAKWDFDVVGKVLARLEGCERLILGFMGQDKLPVEWLSIKSLKGLRFLQLGSPLDAFEASPKPAFVELSTFAPVEKFPHLGRSWHQTFAHLSSNPAVQIANLDLSQFPSFATYLFPSLYPFASTLTSLSIPSLDNANSLFVFFQASISLKSLSISLVTPASIPFLCLLLALPDSLERLSFGTIVGSVAGHYDWSKLGHETDVFSRLVETLRDVDKSRDGLEAVEVGTVKWFLPEHEKRFGQFAAESEGGGGGVRVVIREVDNSRTKEEMAQFGQIVQASLRAQVEQHNIVEDHKGGEDASEGVSGPNGRAGEGTENVDSQEPGLSPN